ncbi:efflux RND transporter periplasmic adaptor subunit [Parvularcula maris]|uniref:HlyD family efflux transporter periplasmic adaptor subunit n=1 Tax=Parvularcula maris TaxID=2965077 RepID=A0A9X2L9H6_9PROT|nr:HlyD family efflux transporter periplasmic adaptor subunit [Parvularcula maris]MCQ8185586.1 HlyD family efflux transporter periplasmic adaptor subunit [Parvularcula maris]
MRVGEMIRSQKWVFIALAVVAAGFGLYFAAGAVAESRQEALPPKKETLPLVEVVDPEPVEQLFVTEEGFLRPRAEIEVIAEVAGKVVEVSPNLQPGGRFEEGDVLFRINPRTLEGDLERARADVASADAAAARAKRLEGIGAASTSQLQQADAAAAAARAGLIAAEKRLDDAVVRAPFAASVISESVALGRYLQPGTVAATIFDTGAAEVVVGLRPEDAAAVRRAAEAQDGPLDVVVSPSRASAGSVTLRGEVKRFGQAVDRLSRTVPVVIEVPGAFSEERGAVFANDYVTVEIPALTEEMLFAGPVGVVRQERFVWILDGEDRLRQVAVTPRSRDGLRVVFSAGQDLRGERLVLTALTEESEGLKVEVADEPERQAAR